MKVFLQTSVEVVADDAQALGKVIESLAQTANGPNHDQAEQALPKLAAIKDPRTVPVWLAIADKPNYTMRFKAIRALATIDDDRALAALVKASKTQASDLDPKGFTTEKLRIQSADQVRLSAAQALSESPHNGALDALLVLEQDRDPSVRLTVLHRAAKLKNARGDAVIKRLLSDPSSMVSGEARRYQSER